MGSTNSSDCIGQIGEVAGQVWRALAEVESTSITKLTRSIDAPRDTVVQAVGWLAREGKLEITEAARGRSISLTERERHLANTTHSTLHVEAA